jgi:hypothetical protein
MFLLQWSGIFPATARPVTETAVLQQLFFKNVLPLLHLADQLQQHDRQLTQQTHFHNGT